MSVIEPTPGRIVWYYASGDDARLGGGGEKLAAMVAKVHDTRMVNLMVVADDGHPVGRPNVQLVQEGDPIPNPPFATWMPFQLGQAKLALDK